MRVQQLLYGAVSGLGYSNVPEDTETGDAQMIQSSLETDATGAVNYFAVRDDMRSLVLNAVANNWGVGPWGTAWGEPLGAGYLSDLPFQPGSMGGQGILSDHEGEWIVLVGDPFAEGCVQVRADTPSGVGCRLKVYATPSESEAIDFANSTYALTAGASHLPGYVLLRGTKGPSTGIPALAEKLKKEIQRASLGIRYGSLIGGLVGLGIIAAVELKSRRR